MQAEATGVRAVPRLDITITELEPSELPLVVSSFKHSTAWRKRGRLASSLWPDVSLEQHYRLAQDVFERIMQRFPLVLAARATDHPALVLGWIAAEPGPAGVVLLYAFTKPDYRRLGVAERLRGRACERLALQSGTGLFYTCPAWGRIDKKLRAEGAEYVHIDQYLKHGVPNA